MQLITFTTQSLFTAHFKKAQQLPFDPAYLSTSTGHFDALVTADLNLAPGEIVRMYTGPENRRRILIVGTPLGNVVLFDRYTDGSLREADSYIVFGNFPIGFRNLYHTHIVGALTFATLECMLGSVPGMGNIGHALETVGRLVADRDAVRV